MAGKLLAEKFKLFDFYHKNDDHVPTQRSIFGGIVTLICVVLTIYLVSSQISSYVELTTEDVLTVDTTRATRIHIHLNITFPSLNCRDVAVDVVDGTNGETLSDAAAQIIKQRLSSFGVALSISRQVELGKTEQLPSEWGPDPKCGSCTAGLPQDYNRMSRFRGGPLPPDACCNTCEELRASFRMRAIPQHFADNAPQCKVQDVPSDSEGCNIHGFLEVPKLRADFHVAAGKGFAQSHEEHTHHVHNIDFGRLDKFNITHTVNSLSFGPPIAGFINPLDGHQVVAQGLAQHLYFIQVVPTTYRAGDLILPTNQYSYTMHHFLIKKNAPSFSLPGVYFRYDMSPLMIEISQKEKSFTDFVVSLCAIIGGIYVFFGILYSLSYNVVNTTVKKRR